MDGNVTYFRTPFCHKDRYTIYMFTALGLMKRARLFFGGDFTGLPQPARRLSRHCETTHDHAVVDYEIKKRYQAVYTAPALSCSLLCFFRQSCRTRPRKAGLGICYHVKC